MEDAYDVCSGCFCHIRTAEPRCPFCGAPHTPKARDARRPLVRMSRAQWLAFGSTLAVVGCTEHFPSGPSQQVPDATMPEASVLDGSSAAETGTWDDAAVPENDAALDETTLEANAPAETGPPEADSAHDARPDTALGDAETATTCTASPGAFICPTAGSCSVCDRATQYCSLGYRTGVPTGCFAFDDDAGPFPFPPGCVARPACECLQDDAGMVMGSITGCSCTDLDDAGALGLHCTACYGSPPARLERLLRAVS